MSSSDRERARKARERFSGKHAASDILLTLSDQQKAAGRTIMTDNRKKGDAGRRQGGDVAIREEEKKKARWEEVSKRRALTLGGQMGDRAS